MAEQYVTTTVRLTKEQHAFLRRTTPNISKALREIIQENMFRDGKATPFQRNIMDQIYEAADFGKYPVVEGLVDNLYNTLMTNGVLVPYDYCAKYLKERKEHQ